MKTITQLRCLFYVIYNKESLVLEMYVCIFVFLKHNINDLFLKCLLSNFPQRFIVEMLITKYAKNLLIDRYFGYFVYPSAWDLESHVLFPPGPIFQISLSSDVCLYVIYYLYNIHTIFLYPIELWVSLSMRYKKIQVIRHWVENEFQNSGDPATAFE